MLKKIPSCVVEKTSKITGKSTHPKESGKLWTFGWWDPEVTPKRLKADIIRNIIITQRQGKSTRITPGRSEEEKKNWTWDKIEHEERLENKKKTWQEIVESPWSAEATEEPLGVGGCCSGVELRCHLKTPARHQKPALQTFSWRGLQELQELHTALKSRRRHCRVWWSQSYFFS